MGRDAQHPMMAMLMIVGELEDPDDLMEAAASMMPRAAVRIPDPEHLNAFLWSEGVLPHVERHLADTVQGA